jgi:hypothetical protein
MLLPGGRRWGVGREARWWLGGELQAHADDEKGQHRSSTTPSQRPGPQTKLTCCPALVAPLHLVNRRPDKLHLALFIECPLKLRARARVPLLLLLLLLLLWRFKVRASRQAGDHLFQQPRVIKRAERRELQYSGELLPRRWHGLAGQEVAHAHVAVAVQVGAWGAGGGWKGGGWKGFGYDKRGEECAELEVGC